MRVRQIPYILVVLFLLFPSVPLYKLYGTSEYKPTGFNCSGALPLFIPCRVRSAGETRPPLRVCAIYAVCRLCAPSSRGWAAPAGRRRARGGWQTKRATCACHMHM